MTSKKRRKRTKQLIAQSKARSGGVHCFYCGTIVKASKATKDHIIAKCRGGTDSLVNLVLSCFLCNHEKSHKPGVWKDRLISLGISQRRIDSYDYFTSNKVPWFHKGFKIE